MTDPKRSSTNTTHRKKLARALVAETGEPYAAALHRVTAASDAGRLPVRLDDDGMAEALRILQQPEPAAPEPGTTYEPGPDHRPVYDLSPDEIAAALADDVRAATATADADVYAPVHRQVADARDQAVWDLSYAYEVLTGQQGLMYVSAPGGGAERWVFGGHHLVAGKGPVALGRAEAHSHLATAVAIARQNVQARLAAIREQNGDGGTIEVDAPAGQEPGELPCWECGERGRYTIDGVTLCTRHRGLLGKWEGRPAPEHARSTVTLVDMDAQWSSEAHAAYVDLLTRWNIATRAISGERPRAVRRSGGSKMA